MKTKGLSWAQAENLLRTGQATFIEFENQFRNVYFMYKGNLRGRFVYDKLSKGTPGRTEGYTFKVVEVPTWAEGLSVGSNGKVIVNFPQGI